MSFLTRFLKIYLVALLLTALGAAVFYWLVIKDNQLAPGVTNEDFRSAVRLGLGAWTGFITLLSLLLAFIGMKRTMTVPVHDRNAFLHRAGAAIAGLSYRPVTQTDDRLVFKARAPLAEKIMIQLGSNSASITAPRGLLKKIAERL